MANLATSLSMASETLYILIERYRRMSNNKMQRR